MDRHEDRQEEVPAVAIYVDKSSPTGLATAQYRKVLEAIKKMSDNLNTRLDEQDAEITDLKTSVDVVVAQLPGLHADLDAATAALNAALASEAVALAENATLKQQLEDAAARVAAGNEKIDAIDKAVEAVDGETPPTG